MGIFAVYLRKLAVTAIILGFLELLLPEGGLRRFAQVILGLLVVMVLLQPLAALVREGVQLDRILTMPELPAPASSDQAARVNAAGLAALTETARAGMERRVNEFCRRSGVALDSLEIAAEAGCITGLKIRLRDSEDADGTRFREALAEELGLPAKLIEVLADG